MNIQLDDRRLWGNEAADDEDPTVLNGYFVNRPEWREFFDSDTRLSIARARKGMGKSAILAECAFNLRSSRTALVVLVKGADLAAQRDLKPLSAMEQVYDWQQRICSVINRRLGDEIGFAISDDAITLVETAELAGFKSRNIVGALLDRLRRKIGPIELEKLAVTDNKAVLQRFLASGEATVTILIDDIDATFSDTPLDHLRLSTFFTACRELAFGFKGISLRTAVRSDVWASIRRFDEALDKVEQYIFDLNWSNVQFSRLLAERIIAYCNRTNRSGLVKDKRASEILELVFPAKYEFTSARVEPHATIRLLAGGRPRWATQLCRMAGSEALRSGTAERIQLEHIRHVLAPFGRHRLDDLSREHKHQCQQIAVVINCFSRRQGVYTTNELLDFASSNILDSVKVAIDGSEVESTAVLVRFLFRIGFIVAFEPSADGNRYFQFEDKPDLLQTRTKLDEGLLWRIHPSLRAVLHLPRTDEA